MCLGARIARAIALLCCLALNGCAAGSLLYYLLWPDYPHFEGGERIALAGLQSEVRVRQRSDGLWRIEAEREIDGMRVLGYLQARDRMAQLDIFRHLARGELAALVGDRPFGAKSSLDVDRLNRFLGFGATASLLYENVSAEEKAAAEAFVAGINDWIGEGHLSLEHRLLGVDQVRAWTVEDSLAIYLMLMHSLGGNADREIRRLAIACAVGIDAMERIWPSDIEYAVSALPEESLGGSRFVPPPAVLPEVAAELPTLCGSATGPEKEVPRDRVDSGLLKLSAVFETLRLGWSASNNWAVSGALTRSGKPVLSTDPHLPHMSPPLMWGFDFATPEYRTAGFTIAGLYRVVFGHNGSVAWGATTNHVDRQDLVILRPGNSLVDGRVVTGYEVDGRFREFEVRTEEFAVRDGDPVSVSVRFTKDGPLLNDLADDARDLLPLIALRVVPFGRGRDLDGARALATARTTREFAAAIDELDLGCSSWVAADTAGSIAYRAPCLVPIRPGWRGTFPVPGWTSRYDWQGYVPKAALPTAFDPERGWLATANNQIVPADRMPTTYNNDVAAPDRFERIAARLGEAAGSLDADASAAIQMDRIDYTWRAVRPDLEAGFCAASAGDQRVQDSRRQLCAWDGDMTADSVGATLYALLTDSMLDGALADELPGGADGELWKFTQSILYFESVVRRLWAEPPDAAVWDDARTPQIETREQILEKGLAVAVDEGTRRFGSSVADWRWGEVRPLVVAHPFAGDGGVLGRVVNLDPVAVGGGNETVFKNQFSLANRAMKVEIGPIIRISIDMADPWAARFALAGGQSGWPSSPHYGDLLGDWASGHTRPLTPPEVESDTAVVFRPGE